MTHDQLSAALVDAASSPQDFPQDRFEGRGIVICAGGARLFTCAWICIGMLRRLGCTLPVEVWHLGPQEMGPPMRSLLAEVGAEAIDAHEVARRHPVRRLGGWELKPYALMHCRFREVLLLDADNVPVRDPTDLFDDEGFRATGALFWPDLLRLSRSNPIWKIAGLPPRDCTSFESGQILLDKSRCWRALALANWMNQHSQEFYGVVHGDKDTFLVAWMLLDQPCQVVPHPPKQLDATICQRAPDGGLLFQHRNGAKWVLHGINPTIEGFRREADCFALLAELGTKWDGHVFNPPARSERARAMERALAAARRYRFVRVTSDERPMDLLPDHRIGGAAGDEFYWYVLDDGDELELVLAGNGAAANRLRRSADGVWRGRLLHGPGTAVELVPVRDDPQQAEPSLAGGEEALQRVLERGLALYESLPGDAETMRDLVGFVRSLARLDPALGARLDALAAAASDGKRAGMLRQALAGWSDGAGIAEGHGWQRHRFPPVGYDPAS